MAKKIEANGSIQAAIEDLLAPPTVEAPKDGWLTVTEWSEKTGMKRTSTRDKINEKIENGTWEMHHFLRINKQGGRQLVPHYRKKP